MKKCFTVFYEEDYRTATISLYEFTKDLLNEEKVYLEETPDTFLLEIGSIEFDVERDVQTGNNHFQVYYYTGIFYKPILLDTVKTLDLATELCRRVFIHQIGMEPPVITGLSTAYKMNFVVPDSKGSSEISEKIQILIPSEDSYPTALEVPYFLFVVDSGKCNIVHILPINPSVAFTHVYQTGSLPIIQQMSSPI